MTARPLHSLLPTPVPEVLVDQARLVQANMPALLIGNLVTSAITATALWLGGQQGAGLAAWAGANLVLVVFGAWRAWALRRRPPHAGNALRRLRSYTPGMAVIGLVWGAGVAAYWARVPVEMQLVLMVMASGSATGALHAFVAWLPGFLAFFVPVVGGLMVGCLLQGGVTSWAIAASAVGYAAYNARFAVLMHASLLDALKAKHAMAAMATDLQVQRDRAEQASTAKSRFLAAASHDLRQPVQAMGLFLAALRDDGGQVGDAALIDHLDASLRNLRAMLTNMLDLSRLDADALSPRLQPVLVDRLLARLLAEQRPLAAARALVLRCRPGCAGAAAQADPALLERMLRNLLANALKYTRAGGVTLVCRRRGAALWLQVFDSGSGIAPAWQSRVFEPFARGDDALRGDADGLGLGLAITQRMAALQGLQLRLHSRPGRGSVFTIVLPVAAALPTEHAAPAAADDPAAPVAMAANAGGAPPRLVLVVDDDPAVAAATAALLRVWGHDTLVCHADADALAAVAAARRVPDLLITDARLAGGRSGLALAARIGQRIGRPLPVIVLTGDTAPERITQAAAAGHPLLHKPVDPQRLRACIAAVWLQAAPPHGA